MPHWVFQLTMSCWKPILAWVGRTRLIRRSLPVVGSFTFVWFQSFLNVKRPPLMPSLSVGITILTDRRSSVPSPILPVADRLSGSGRRSMTPMISSWR